MGRSALPDIIPPMATESRTLIFLALIANGLIAIIKFVAAGISGSSAMLAEAFHSVADTGNQLFLLRGSAVSRYAPDAKHPFGRGKELYFWSFMVAVFLFVGGAVVAFLEGLEKVRHPEEGSGLVFSLIVLGLAALFEIFIAFRPALREFNRVRGSRSVMATVRGARDPALIVVVFEDTAAVVGLVIAAAGLILADVTGWAQWDGIASIVIALLLAGVAWLLAYEMKALLVGEAAGRRERSLIRSATLGVDAVESIGRLLTMQLSPSEILVNMDVDLAGGLSDAEIEETIDAIEEAVTAVVPEATRIFVELESAR
jgi:cation diffusion facilitator family transporter